MVRVAFVVGLPCLILAAMLHINPWVILVPVALVGIYAYTVGGQKLRCPECRKRVKIGAHACHHCSWTASAPTR